MSNDKIFLTLPSKLWSASIVRHVARDFLILSGKADCAMIDDIEVAIGEAIANVVNHTYQRDETKIISVYMKIEDGFFEIGIRDFGPKNVIDFENYSPPPPMSESGRGVGLINSLVDEVKYEETCRGNLLVLRRKIA
ncbi:ATP-binding protein [Athalassotoga saccharophila]|uniref:ATP-binding protein n=1 Tax=Athalassotoga saccharophila TaxID=1441386 RepID=UPI00137A75CC|nr:ATP-binding protein [Athalassotoga saccharophila]BBJ28018.1 anti-sigma F factor [Athalassotoga saccharophila]